MFKKIATAAVASLSLAACSIPDVVHFIEVEDGDGIEVNCTKDTTRFVYSEVDPDHDFLTHRTLEQHDQDLKDKYGADSLEYLWASIGLEIADIARLACN